MRNTRVERGRRLLRLPRTALVLCLVLFAILPPRRAVLVGLLGGWLFLPVARYELSGLPDYSKFSAISFGLLLGIFLFDLRRLLEFRPRWVDVFMVA